MWPRQWSKLSSRTINNRSFSFKDLRSLVTDDADNYHPQTTTTTSAASRTFPPSFSFKDLCSLVNDDDEDDHHKHHQSAVAPKPSVFHRVRVATATLRAWKSLSSTSAAAEKKIVLYYTSLRVVRKTFEECRTVRSILRGFRVAIDERDLSMDSGFLTELKQIAGSKKQLSLPRVFIGGRYVGGFEEIQQLHESGELKKIVEGVPAAMASACDRCGGIRFVLCHVCSGSHKYFTDKARFRICNACNENGLVRCPDCCTD